MGHLAEDHLRLGHLVGLLALSLEDLLRRRIRQHNNWDTRTLSIRFVSLTKRSMIAKMGTKHFRPMVERWRWLEPTFAPIIQFRTMNFSWRTRIL